VVAVNVTVVFAGMEDGKAGHDKYVLQLGTV
jgi:hypothetical protein